jgi:hypothetical protein
VLITGLPLPPPVEGELGNTLIKYIVLLVGIQILKGKEISSI